jgi:hypothetical protein
MEQDQHKHDHGDHSCCHHQHHHDKKTKPSPQPPAGANLFIEGTLGIRINSNVRQDAGPHGCTIRRDSGSGSQ